MVAEAAQGALCVRREEEEWRRCCSTILKGRVTWSKIGEAGPPLSQALGEAGLSGAGGEEGRMRKGERDASYKQQQCSLLVQKPAAMLLA